MSRGYTKTECTVSTDEAGVWDDVDCLVTRLYPCVASLRSFPTARRDVDVAVQPGLLLPHSRILPWGWPNDTCFNAVRAKTVLLERNQRSVFSMRKGCLGKQ